ncbi:MAG: COX15/CtaA family protein [Proteobacteria bacterium]|nr:COX15/CtaA family protein [Pseudomonadota bacterium]
MGSRRFSRYSWGVLAYTVLVIAWGAFVRASGSGAGCGEHWPLCNGVVVPRSPGLETIVELSHRLTSGLTLIAVAIMVIWAFRKFPKGHALRQGSVLTGIFLVLEAAVGAGLVLAALVKDNASILRAVVISAHLLNTFLLVGSMTYVAWYATRGRSSRFRVGIRGWQVPTVLVGLVLFMIVGSSGAIVALGDTLFPTATLTEGLAQDFSPTAHFLIRLRIVHPILAMLTSAYWLVVSTLLRNLSPNKTVVRLSTMAAGAVVFQVLLGCVNLVLLAPTWIQLAHLIVADLTWVILMILSLEVLHPEEN